MSGTLSGLQEALERLDIDQDAATDTDGVELMIGNEFPQLRASEAAHGLSAAYRGGDGLRHCSLRLLR